MFEESESRSGSPGWETFDALKLTRLDAHRWRAEIEYRSREGKKEKKTFEGTREELRKDLLAEKDLPENERQSLAAGPQSSRAGLRVSFSAFWPAGTGFVERVLSRKSTSMPDSRTLAHRCASGRSSLRASARHSGTRGKLCALLALAPAVFGSHPRVWLVTVPATDLSEETSHHADYYNEWPDGAFHGLVANQDEPSIQGRGGLRFLGRLVFLSLVDHWRFT